MVKRGGAVRLLADIYSGGCDVGEVAKPNSRIDFRTARAGDGKVGLVVSGGHSIAAIFVGGDDAVLIGYFTRSSVARRVFPHRLKRRTAIRHSFRSRQPEFRVVGVSCGFYRLLCRSRPRNGF